MGFGGSQKVIISGGSALSSSLEEFYADAGIPIVVGYGLTETSPLISFRQMDRNLKVGGCVGFPCKDTEIKVVDESTRIPVPQGSPGVVLARGPQVMRGYYNNEEATKKAVDKDGFFDTGDLGRICEATGDLILTGRAKDTIVLSNGENIEPQPLEDSILKSDLIDQIVLSGDDGRRLVAICVLSIPGLVARGFMTQEQEKMYSPLVDRLNEPQYDPDACAEAAEELRSLTKSLRSNGDLAAAVQDDMKGATGVKGGFRAWER
jgi:long-chain acyl-CoA synthetase